MNQPQLDVPVLLIVFKREKEALATLQAIKKARPKKIYIAGDAARDHVEGEKNLVEITRKSVMAHIDWDCEVTTLFHESNLGCGPGVYTAINWFFDHEEMGIILEDDCVALPSFFNFSQELLQKYKNDERIALISGFNDSNSAFGPYSYCFSKYVICWGWATWKRAWKNMDYEMSWRNGPMEKSIVTNAGYLGKDYDYWERRIQAVEKSSVSAWDYQWCFTVAAQNQLGIFPEKNLISNIGIGDGATHTTKSPFATYSATNDLEFPLRHPKSFAPNMEFDKALYKSRNSLINTLAWFFPKPVKDFVKMTISKFYSKD